MKKKHLNMYCYSVISSNYQGPTILLLQIAHSYNHFHHPHHHHHHPPSCRYAWYRILGDQVLAKGSFQNLTFPSVRAHLAGQYYCTAWNRFGYQTSPVATLTILCK